MLRAPHPRFWHDSATFGPCAFSASVLSSRCRPEQIHRVFAHQDALTPQNLKDQVLGWAKGAKDVDALKLGACIDNKSTEAEVDTEMKEGQDLTITGTPTMFINGRKISQTIDWPNLKNIIDTEIEYQKVAHNAGDDCGCEVQLPVPAIGKPPAVGLPKKK